MKWMFSVRINLHSPLEMRINFFWVMWSRWGRSRSSMVTAAIALILVEAVLWKRQVVSVISPQQLTGHIYTLKIFFSFSNELWDYDCHSRRQSLLPSWNYTKYYLKRSKENIFILLNVSEFDPVQNIPNKSAVCKKCLPKYSIPFIMWF